MEIKDFWIDLVHHTITIGSNTASIPPELLPHGNIEGFGFLADDWALRIRLPGGREVEAELPRGAAAPPDDRPVVYLDQNHWSRLARARSGLRPGDAHLAEAAETLEGLVEARSIRIAASGGNFVETVALYGQRRVDLAETILELSRGWQMRHPLDVRLDELRACFTTRPPAAAPVFAPGADSAFEFAAPKTAAMDLPGWLFEVVQHVPRIVGLYETLVEPTAINDSADVAERLAGTWASAFAELAVRLAADAAGHDIAWRAVHGNLLLDHIGDISSVASEFKLTTEQAITRLCDTDDPVSRAPFLSRLRAWLFARVRNSQQRWESNDLVDGMYLCCAAGYADLVVGERNAIGYLRQARNCPAGAELTTSLSEAVTVLGHLT